MSPTVFRYKGYRFFFFSREETRMHIHVYSAEGEAKFWMEPVTALVDNYGFNVRQIREIQRIIEEHKDEIEKSWKKHFRR